MRCYRDTRCQCDRCDNGHACPACPDRERCLLCPAMHRLSRLWHTGLRKNIVLAIELILLAVVITRMVEIIISWGSV